MQSILESAMCVGDTPAAFAHKSIDYNFTVRIFAFIVVAAAAITFHFGTNFTAALVPLFIYFMCSFFCLAESPHFRC